MKARSPCRRSEPDRGGRRPSDDSPPSDAQNRQAAPLAGLAGSGENRYIRRNLWFSYDRVLRVGPAGPALFYYLNGPQHITPARSGRPAGPAVSGPAQPTQVRPPT
jgi:hypothetical protein